jgi:hypothetical protein
VVPESDPERGIELVSRLANACLPRIHLSAFSALYLERSHLPLTVISFAHHFDRVEASVIASQSYCEVPSV